VKNFNPETAGPEELAEFRTMLKYVQPSYPKPMLDCRVTTEALGFEPTSVDDGLKQTLQWFRANKKI